MKIHSQTDVKSSATANELLTKIFSAFIGELKPHMLAFFESLDDTLFDLAEKAENNQTQTLYFETMRLLRKSRGEIQASFVTSIQSAFKSFKQNEFDYFPNDLGYNPKIKSLSLSLIDEKELDETLAKTNLINKSEMAYHRMIYAMKIRFLKLTTSDNLKSNQIPISPFVLVNSFAKSLKVLDVDTTLKIILYKLFERNVMGQLSKSYKKTNEFLANKGIVPEISYNLGRQNQSAVTLHNTAVKDNSNQQESKEQELPSQQESGNTQNIPTNNVNQQKSEQDSFIDPNYQVISQLFKSTRQGQQEKNDVVSLGDNSGNTQNQNFDKNTGQYQGGTQSNVSNIDLNSMMNALSILQGDIFNDVDIREGSNQSPIEIKDELIKRLHQLDSQTKNQKVQKKDEDTIDLVGMLFQFIVEDRNLPDAIQVILVKLQIPYLKIALQDRNLFALTSHPARVVLDKMSIASLGWSPESDNKNIFILKIEDITKKILNIDEYQEELFQALIKDFDEFVKKQKKKSDVIQKRTKEKSLGKEKINQAKERSAKMLVEKMTNKQMPILVRDLLLGEWSNVMVLMHLRHDPDSDNFKEKVVFIDLVINYSNPRVKGNVSKENIKDLSHLYEKGLKLVAFNPKELIDKLDALVKCLNKINGISQEQNADKVELISPKDILKLSDINNKEHEIIQFIEKIVEDDSHEEELIDDDYMKVVSQLKTGAWLEFIRNDKNSTRAKLSWISPITGKYLFVNSRGLKLTDESKYSLSTGLRNKTIRILQQIALFDRALSAIATKLIKEDESEN